MPVSAAPLHMPRDFIGELLLLLLYNDGLEYKHDKRLPAVRRTDCLSRPPLFVEAQRFFFVMCVCLTKFVPLCVLHTKPGRLALVTADILDCVIDLESSSTLLVLHSVFKSMMPASDHALKSASAPTLDPPSSPGL